MQGPGAVRSQSSAPRGPGGAGGARLSYPGTSGASEAGVGTTKEVLGSIIDFLAFNWDFIGFPILLLGFPRISSRILSGF